MVRDSHVIPTHDRLGQPVHDRNLFSGINKDFPDKGNPGHFERWMRIRTSAAQPRRCEAASAGRHSQARSIQQVLHTRPAGRLAGAPGRGCGPNVGSTTSELGSTRAAPTAPCRDGHPKRLGRAVFFPSRFRSAPGTSSSSRSASNADTTVAIRACQSSRSPCGWRPDVPPGSLVKKPPVVVCAHLGAPVHEGTRKLRTRPLRRFRLTFIQRRATVQMPKNPAGQLAGPQHGGQGRRAGRVPGLHQGHL